MSTSPIDTVRAFLAIWSEGPEAIYRALYDYLAPDAVYENIGLSYTRGPAEAHACFAAFGPMKNCLRLDVDVLAIAAAGNKVLVERIDRVIERDGRETMAAPVMGIFEVTDGRITAWRDYFDTAPFAQQQHPGSTRA
jgi:limonene-1,2-epoxide hydrolase